MNKIIEKYKCPCCGFYTFDEKHVNCLPDLRKHANLQRLFIIDTGIDIKELPNYLQEKVSNWDDR